MRTVSLNARTALEDIGSAEVEVALFSITHPSIDGAIRLSTDPTTRLSDDPLQYGTISTWDGGSAEDPFLFILAAAGFPSDVEDAPSSTTLIVDNVDRRIADMLRALSGRATLHMAVVLASDPNVLEVEFRNMKIVSSDGNAQSITLQVSREPIEGESVPKDRFTKARFPGLFA